MDVACIEELTKEHLQVIVILLISFFFRLVFVGDSSIPTDIPTVIREKQDLPRTVIISISIIGVILLLINIGLVAGCLFKKRAKKLRGLY